MSDQKDGGQRPDHETGGVQRGFQLPGWIWAAMVGCYAIFFAFILLATGGMGARCLRSAFLSCSR